MTEDEINIEIGRRLRKQRLKKGFNLKEAARMADMPYQQFQKYEAGQRRILAAKLLLIASRLGFDENDLLPEIF